MPKMGMGMGRVHATIEMEMATFSHVPKLPSFDWMRMRCNKMLYCNVTSFLLEKSRTNLAPDSVNSLLEHRGLFVRPLSLRHAVKIHEALQLGHTVRERDNKIKRRTAESVFVYAMRRSFNVRSCVYDYFFRAITLLDHADHDGATKSPV